MHEARQNSKEFDHSIARMAALIASYRKRLEATLPPSEIAAIGSISTLDSLLLTLVLELIDTPCHLVDYAASETVGLSTVIALQVPEVQAIYLVETDQSSPIPSWRLELERYRRSLGDESLASLEILGTSTELRKPLVLFKAGDRSSASIPSRLNELIELTGEGHLVALGLGSVGRCDWVKALLDQAGSQHGRRFTLLRELEGVLGGSTLGLVSPDNPGTELLLDRISKFFLSNFDYLRMVDAQCQFAIALTELSEATRRELTTGDGQSGVSPSLLVHRHQALESERDGLRAESEALRTDIDNLLGTVWSLREEVKRLEGTVWSLRTEEERQRGRLLSLEAERDETRRELADVRSRRVLRIADRVREIDRVGIIPWVTGRPRRIG